jgi:hypothetical protein
MDFVGFLRMGPSAYSGFASSHYQFTVKLIRQAADSSVQDGTIETASSSVVTRKIAQFCFREITITPSVKTVQDRAQFWAERKEIAALVGSAAFVLAVGSIAAVLRSWKYTYLWAVCAISSFVISFFSFSRSSEAKKQQDEWSTDFAKVVQEEVDRTNREGVLYVMEHLNDPLPQLPNITYATLLAPSKIDLFKLYVQNWRDELNQAQQNDWQALAEKFAKTGLFSEPVSRMTYPEDSSHLQPYIEVFSDYCTQLEKRVELEKDVQRRYDIVKQNKELHLEVLAAARQAHSDKTQQIDGLEKRETEKYDRDLKRLTECQKAHLWNLFHDRARQIADHAWRTLQKENLSYGLPIEWLPNHKSFSREKLQQAVNSYLFPST